MPTISSKRKKRLVRTCIGLGVIVALIIGLVIRCSGSSHTSRDTPTTKQIGQGVTATSEQMPSGTKANVLKEQGKPYELGHGLSPMLSITPTGTLKAPITLTIPLSETVAQGTRVFVAANFTHKPGDWQVLGARLTADRKHAQVTTNHFSFFWPFMLDVSGTTKTFKQDITDSLSSSVTAKANKPACQNESQARANDYQITSSAKNTLYWCFGVEGGKHVLKVVNRQKYPLNVYHKGLKVLSAGHIQAEVTQIARWGSGNITILYPRDEAVMQVDDLARGNKATVSTEYSGYAEALYNFDVAYQATVTIMTKFGLKDIGVRTPKYWEYMNKMLNVKDCANAVTDRNLGKMMAKCFRDVLADPYGKIGSAILFAVVDTTLMVVDWLIGQFKSVSDTLGDADKYGVTVSRQAAVPLIPTKYVGEFSYAPSAFMVIGKDGSVVLKQYEDGSNNHSTVKLKLSGSGPIYTTAVTSSDDAHTPVESLITFKFYSSGVLGVEGISDEVKFSMFCRKQCIIDYYPELNELNKDNGY